MAQKKESVEDLTAEAREALRLGKALQVVESGDEILDVLECSAIAGLRKRMGLASETPPWEVFDRALAWRRESRDSSTGGPLSQEAFESQSFDGLVMQVDHVLDCRKAIAANDLQAAVLHAAQAGHHGASDRISVQMDRASKALGARLGGQSGGNEKSKRSRKKKADRITEYDERVAAGEPEKRALGDTARNHGIQVETLKRDLRNR